jgi:hypothetical protein
MVRWIRISSCLFIAALFAVVTLPGCNKKETAKPVDQKKDAHADHGDGPHGGPLAEWEEKYHGEFTLDAAKKQVTVYILDDTAKAAPKIDAAKITNVTVTVAKSKPPITLELKHDAKRSDDKGIAFVGTHDHFEKSGEMTVNISADIDGKHYSNDVTYKPSKTTQLYLTPGGIYTVADINANGNTTPEQKFKGKKWAHEDGLKVGDKICPITKNKAEADCAWIIQKQRYEFCCPPCLDKFMGWAHNDTAKVKEADQYVFKGS